MNERELELAEITGRSSEASLVKMVEDGLIDSDCVEIPFRSLIKLDNIKRVLRDQGYLVEVLKRPDVTDEGNLVYDNYLMVRK